MTITVLLKVQNNNTSYEIPDVLIEMSDFPVDLINNLSNTVYEDKNYTITVKDNEEIIDNFELYINDEPVKIHKKFIKEPFKRLYGLTDIRLEIDEKILYSTPLCIAINQKDAEQENSLKIMIDEIMQKEHYFLYTKSCFQNSKEKIKLHKNLDINSEIKLLKKIINTYNNNYQNFSINPYTRCSQIYKKNKTEKLNSIDYTTIQYIVSNPHEYRYHNSPTGMTYNKMPITPENTLTKSIVKSLDLYENKQILGFIQTISQYIDLKINEISSIRKDIQSIKPKENIINGYKLSTQIIEFYSTSIYTESQKELLKMKEEILSIKSKYENCFKMFSIPIKTIPKPTPIFMEIFHYRQIFLVIKEWFSSKHINITDPSIILNFPSADKIYELYTLIHLFENITNSGYKLIDSINFNYNRHDKIYKPTKYNNTFKFIKDNKNLTLYFQPVIHCSLNKKDNGIELCRTDKKTTYYYPDYIIKIEQNDSTMYSILDSKWSTIENIKDYYWLNAIYKYFFSVVRTDVESNIERISNLWLISGKNSSEKIYYHNKNSLAENNITLKNSTGIVELTPNNSELGFNRIIQHITK